MPPAFAAVRRLDRRSLFLVPVLCSGFYWEISGLQGLGQYGRGHDNEERARNYFLSYGFWFCPQRMEQSPYGLP